MRSVGKACIVVLESHTNWRNKDFESSAYDSHWVGAILQRVRIGHRKKEKHEIQRCHVPGPLEAT